MSAVAFTREEKIKRPAKGPVPNLSITDANAYLELLTKILGEDAQPYWKFTIPDDDTKLFHAVSLVNGRSIIFEDNEVGFNVLENSNGPDRKIKARVSVAVADATKVEALAIENGAKVIERVAKQFWGGVYGIFRDPNGVVWSVSEPSSPDTWEPSSAEIWNLVPELAVRDPELEMEFVKKVFGAEQDGEINKNPSGQVMHSTFRIDGGLIFINSQLTGEPRDADVSLHFTVPKGDAASFAAKFVENGSETIMPVALQFWGQIYGRVQDSYGLQWGISEPECKNETGESSPKKPRND